MPVIRLGVHPSSSGSSNSRLEPERGCVVLDQPQQVEEPQRFWPDCVLRLISDTAALLKMSFVFRLETRVAAAGDPAAARGFRLR